jgi:hypothetical protein
MAFCRGQLARFQSWLGVVALHEGARLLRLAGREPLAEEVCSPEDEARRADGLSRSRSASRRLWTVAAREALPALADLRSPRRRVLALRWRMRT